MRAKPPGSGRPRIRRLALALLPALLLPAAALHAQSAPDSTTLAQEARLAELRAGLTDAIAAGPLGDPDVLARAHNSLGLAYWTGSQFDSAIVHLDRARELFAANGDRAGVGRALNNIGVTYYQWGHFEPALEAFKRSLVIRRELDDLRGTSLVLTNKGRTYQELQLFDRAGPILQEALEVAYQADDGEAQGYAEHNIGLLAIATGDYVRARQMLTQSMATYQAYDSINQRNATSGWSLNMVGLGLLDIREGDPDAAIARMHEVLASAREENHLRRQAHALLQLGRAWLAKGDADRAINLLQESLAISTDVAQRSIALEALHELAGAQEARGDTRAALASLRAHAALRDSVFNQAAVRRIALAELRAQADRQEADNLRLREEQQASEALIARQRIVVSLGGALLLMTALLAAVLVHFNRTGRHREELLAATNTSLEASNTDLRAALSEVRTLKGLIPICAHCKKVRDDSGFWEAVETYITQRSDASFSHGICTECGPRLYGNDWPEDAGERVASGRGTG
jgi:tetratricopeptide (TPR) repeat protein